MQRLNGLHAMRLDRRYNRSGHLFQGRFETRVITDDGYLETLIGTSSTTRPASVSEAGRGAAYAQPRTRGA